MAGNSTTGQPNNSDYNLGRGALYFASNDATTGLSGAYRHLGNCPEFSVTLDVETLEHQSSLSGLKTTDKEVVVSQTMNLTLSLDEINFDNLALFLAGSNATGHTNITSLSGNNVLTSSATLGRYYDLYDDATGNRVYDITAKTDLSLLSDPGSSSVTLSEGTDYTVDLKMGRILILYNSPNTVASAPIWVTYTATGTPIATIDQVEALTTTSVAGSLKFISQNPTDADHQTEWQFHQVSLKAEGDLSLIGDDWTVMQLTGKAEKNTGSHAAVSNKTLTVRTHTDA